MGAPSSRGASKDPSSRGASKDATLRSKGDSRQISPAQSRQISPGALALGDDYRASADEAAVPVSVVVAATRNEAPKESVDGDDKAESRARPPPLVIEGA